MHPRRASQVLAGFVARPAVRRPAVRALRRGAFRELARMARTAARSPDRGAEKIVCPRYRFLCLLVPKAASRSLLTVIRDLAPDTDTFFDTDLREVYSEFPEARDYFSFAFVRNPYTRALSLHAELFCQPSVYAAGYDRYRGKRNRTFYDPVAGRPVRFRAPLETVASPEKKEEKRRNLFARHYGLEETRDFDDFCDWLHSPWGSDEHADRHFLSQHRQVRLEDGSLPDFVGRVERFAEGLEEVGRRLGLPVPALPLLNTMAGWQSTPEELEAAQREAGKQLTERNRRLLRSRYAADFSLGGYAD